MKRKRFVKKLMSIGYSRNAANQRAARARKLGRTYQECWSGPEITRLVRPSFIGIDLCESVSRAAHVAYAFFADASMSTYVLSRALADANRLDRLLGGNPDSCGREGST